MIYYNTNGKFFNIMLVTHIIIDYNYEIHDINILVFVVSWLFNICKLQGAMISILRENIFPPLYNNSSFESYLISNLLS